MKAHLQAGDPKPGYCYDRVSRDKNNQGWGLKSGYQGSLNTQLSWSNKQKQKQDLFSFTVTKTLELTMRNVNNSHFNKGIVT